MQQSFLDVQRGETVSCTLRVLLPFMGTNLQLTSSLAKTMAFLRSINHVFATKCLFARNWTEIKFQKNKKIKKIKNKNKQLLATSDQVFFSLFFLTDKLFIAVHYLHYNTVLTTDNTVP